jgi:hypothetical protein
MVQKCTINHQVLKVSVILHSGVRNRNHEKMYKKNADIVARTHIKYLPYYMLLLPQMLENSFWLAYFCAI